MALGCNMINMAAMSTLVAYPLIFRPLVHYPASGARLLTASILFYLFGWLFKERTITRIEGALLTSIYIAYVAILLIRL